MTFMNKKMMPTTRRVVERVFIHTGPGEFSELLLLSHCCTTSTARWGQRSLHVGLRASFEVQTIPRAGWEAQQKTQRIPTARDAAATVLQL